MKSSFFAENPTVTALLLLSTIVTIISACFEFLPITIIGAILSCIVSFYSGIATHETLVSQNEHITNLEQETKRHDDEIKDVKQQADESTDSLIWKDVSE